MNWITFWISMLLAFSTFLVMSGIILVIASEKNRTLYIGVSLIVMACVLLSLAIGLV
jgi:hypothetical protein